MKDHRIGKDGASYAQQLAFGWVIIGNVCLGSVHNPTDVHTFKTSILPSRRHTVLEACENVIHVEDDPIFQRSPADERLGLSIENQVFLDMMSSRFKMSDDKK